ncbi:MAG: 4Fe-4S dicluster domain-containing protein [Candidatus Adiutrix sp.]|jgi:ferredoxin|nr:4Fe-4S dicluster domain-containing protein [Candidatus Adiutrix sp.]
MAEYIVKENALKDFFKALTEGGKRRFLAPAEVSGKLQMIETDPEKVSLDFGNTHQSPKSAFFPQTEKLMAFHKDTAKSDPFVYKPLGLDETAPMVLFGLRPCDARGLVVCDRVFQNNRFTDPYWKSKYESAVKIGLACHDPRPACFCTAVGGSPFGEAGLDAIAFVRDGGLALKTLSAEGGEFLKGLSGLESAEIGAELAEKKQAAEAGMPGPLDQSKVAGAAVMEIYNQPHWKDTADRCLNCGTCTFVCPTCHCFDIQDEQNEKGGLRMRNWDTCMSWLYTVHGTGHNPRPTKTERMRQRFMHKLKYIPMKQDGACGCIGCGRCVTLCPVNIDIREVARQMNG